MVVSRTGLDKFLVRDGDADDLLDRVIVLTASAMSIPYSSRYFNTKNPEGFTLLSVEMYSYRGSVKKWDSNYSISDSP